MVGVTRSSGLSKAIQQGTVPGGRKRGRQKKRWQNPRVDTPRAKRHLTEG